MHSPDAFDGRAHHRLFVGDDRERLHRRRGEPRFNRRFLQSKEPWRELRKGAKLESAGDFDRAAASAKKKRSAEKT